MTLVSAADLTVNEDNEFALGIIGVILPVGLVGLVVGYLLVKFTSLSLLQTFAGVGLIMYCLLLFADKNPIRKVAGPFKRLDQAHHANIQES